MTGGEGGVAAMESAGETEGKGSGTADRKGIGDFIPAEATGPEPTAHATDPDRRARIAQQVARDIMTQPMRKKVEAALTPSV